MRSIRFALSLTLLASLSLAGSAFAQTPATQDDDVIRIETDLTNLLFIATDKQNHFITTLRQQDLRLLEDGVPQQLFTFQRETDRLVRLPYLDPCLLDSVEQECLLRRERSGRF